MLVVDADVHAANLDGSDVDEAIVDETLWREPERAVAVAVNEGAELRVPRCDASVHGRLRAGLPDSPVQVDRPPVHRRVEMEKKARLQHYARALGRRPFRLELEVSPNDRIIAHEGLRRLFDEMPVLGGGHAGVLTLRQGRLRRGADAGIIVETILGGGRE